MGCCPVTTAIPCDCAPARRNNLRKQKITVQWFERATAPSHSRRMVSVEELRLPDKWQCKGPV
jgi:hypothetical protein